jgi:hypothetical protein
MEPGKAIYDHNWLFTSLAQSVVKLSIVGAEPSEASDQSCQGHQCSKTVLIGETWFHSELVHCEYKLFEDFLVLTLLMDWTQSLEGTVSK